MLVRYRRDDLLNGEAASSPLARSDRDAKWNIRYLRFAYKRRDAASPIRKERKRIVWVRLPLRIPSSAGRFPAKAGNTSPTSLRPVCSTPGPSPRRSRQQGGTGVPPAPRAARDRQDPTLSGPESMPPSFISAASLTCYLRNWPDRAGRLIRRPSPVVRPGSRGRRRTRDRGRRPRRPCPSPPAPSARANGVGP